VKPATLDDDYASRVARQPELLQHCLHVRAAPSLDAQAVFEVGERRDEVTPVQDDAVQSLSLAIRGIMVDNILSEEPAEPLKLARP
jgi:hypothetical protein